MLDLSFDYKAKIIHVVSGTDVDVIDLYDRIKIAQATFPGILYQKIAYGSGRVGLGRGAEVGLTVELLGDWRLKFWEGNYIAYVFNGNLVSKSELGTIAYTPGVQVLFLLSESATVVNIAGTGLTQGQIDLLYEILAEAKLGRQMQTNRAEISEDKKMVTVFADDGTTVLHVFSISDDYLRRVPA